ncbi:YrhB family protein [Pseudomonas syringae]
MSLSAQLAGNGPFLIDKETGELHVLGTAKPLKEYLDHYVISKSKK